MTNPFSSSIIVLHALGPWSWSKDDNADSALKHSWGQSWSNPVFMASGHFKRKAVFRQAFVLHFIWTFSTNKHIWATWSCVYFCKNLLLLCCKLSTESFMLAFLANTVTVTIWVSYSVKKLEVATFHWMCINVFRSFCGAVELVILQFAVFTSVLVTTYSLTLTETEKNPLGCVTKCYIWMNNCEQRKTLIVLF